jgi:hypothetical protein
VTAIDPIVGAVLLLIMLPVTASSCIVVFGAFHMARGWDS